MPPGWPGSSESSPPAGVLSPVPPPGNLKQAFGYRRSAGRSGRPPGGGGRPARAAVTRSNAL
eukprot:38170-Hanusia_phi.AAC.1